MNHLLPHPLHESRQTGVLYHFTELFALVDILTVLELYPTEELRDGGFISTTRRYDLKWGTCRLTLDGNKLSHRYKIAPIHYFNIRHARDISDYRATGDEGVSVWNPKGKLPMNQYEERIFTNDGIKLLPYLLRIDVMPHAGMDKEAHRDYRKICARAKKLGLEIHEVEKFMPYKAAK